MEVSFTEQALGMRHGQAIRDRRPNNNPQCTHTHLILQPPWNAAANGSHPSLCSLSSLVQRLFSKGDAQMKEAKLIALATIETSL